MVLMPVLRGETAPSEERHRLGRIRTTSIYSLPFALQKGPEGSRPWVAKLGATLQADLPQNQVNITPPLHPAKPGRLGGEEARPTSTVYKFHNFIAAEELAKRMSHVRRLDLIHEAAPD